MLSVQQERDQKFQGVLGGEDEWGSLTRSSSSFSIETSTGDVFCIPVPVKLYTSKESNVKSSVARTKSQKRINRVTDDHEKKFENFRQTVIRFFKRNMRRLLKLFKQIEKTKRPKIAAKRILKTLKKLYTLDELPSNESYDTICRLLRTVDNFDYFECKISNVGENFKSCNNRYIQWLFETQIIKDLYSFHHTLAKDSYLRILNITDALSPVELEQLFEFIENIPYKTK